MLEVICRASVLYNHKDLLLWIVFLLRSILGKRQRRLLKEMNQYLLIVTGNSSIHLISLGYMLYTTGVELLFLCEMFSSLAYRLFRTRSFVSLSDVYRITVNPVLYTNASHGYDNSVCLCLFLFLFLFWIILVLVWFPSFSLDDSDYIS